jgi:uncharacterized protein
MNLIQINKNEIIALCDKYSVDELYAFGSVLNDTFTKESNIDLLVRFGDVNLFDYFDNYMDFKESLENLFNRNVDLVEIQTLKNPILKGSINNEKTLIYGRADSKVSV